MIARRICVSVLMGMAGLATVGGAGATTLPTGSTLSPCATLYASNSATCNVSVAPTLTTPGLYTYNDLSLSPASSTGGIIAGSTYPTGYTGASFYDAFVFTIASSQTDSISSTINLPPSFAISNFQERLYSYSLTNQAPYVGKVTGALDLWTFPAGPSGSVAVLPATTLGAGTYVVEVRGDVTGTVAGGYSGTLQLQTVPLPAGLPLLLSGLGSLGLFARRRGSKAAGA